MKFVNDRIVNDGNINPSIYKILSNYQIFYPNIEEKGGREAHMNCVWLDNLRCQYDKFVGRCLCSMHMHKSFTCIIYILECALHKIDFDEVPIDFDKVPTPTTKMYYWLILIFSKIYISLAKKKSKIYISYCNTHAYIFFLQLS